MKHPWLIALAAVVGLWPPPTKKAKGRTRNRQSSKARRHRKVRRSLAKAGRRAARRGE